MNSNTQADRRQVDPKFDDVTRRSAIEDGKEAAMRDEYFEDAETTTSHITAEENKRLRRKVHR